MFDNETIFSIATYGVIVSGLSLALVMAVRLWRNRPTRVGHMLSQVEPLTPEQEHVLCTTLEALDRVVMALEQDEAFLRELALGNDVVRLDECRAVEEAWEIIERKMPR
jgi:hypothetical protein